MLRPHSPCDDVKEPWNMFLKRFIETSCSGWTDSSKWPCVPFGRAPPYALTPSKGLPSRVRASKGWGVYRTKQLFLEVPFCVIILCQYGSAVIMERISAKNHGGGRSVHQLYPSKSFITKVCTTLQYGSHDCFHSEVPFGRRYILFGTHHELDFTLTVLSCQCVALQSPIYF